MSLIADDVINFTSMLKMSYNFLAGRDYLKKQKFRERKKLVSVALPFSDLCFAAGAVPVFPIRMEIFDINQYLMAMNTATTFFGWSTVAKFLGFVKQFDKLKIADNIIGDVIDSINIKYNEMYDIAEEHGLNSDFCYGIKAVVGMHVSKGRNVDANLNYTIRCSAWNKYLEYLKNLVPDSEQIWIVIPPRNLGDSALNSLEENLYQAVAQLENLTGNHLSNNSLNKQFRLRNQICRYYKIIIHEISANDYYPCNPATFAEILSLLSISFQDYNSNVNQYLDNMGNLLKEMEERIKKRIGMDVSHMPRVLLTPMFGGWEPLSHEYLYELGVRTIYADWEVLGFLEEIPITNDPIKEYAHFLLNMTTKGFGCDNSGLTDSYLKVAKELKVDGVVFNQVFGCHSVSNCYQMLREKLRREGIPSTFLNFNKIGENTEQVKTRLGAFTEMLK